MADNQFSPSVATRGIQLPLIAPLRRPLPITAVEPKGVVYTKRWVVELLLDLSGYSPDKNLVDSLAVEPAAGDGTFLGPMIERLVESCRKLGRSLSECQNALLAYVLDETSAARSRTIVQDLLVVHGAKSALAKNWLTRGLYREITCSMPTRDKPISLSAILRTYALRTFQKRPPQSTEVRIRRCANEQTCTWRSSKPPFGS